MRGKKDCSWDPNCIYRKKIGCTRRKGVVSRNGEAPLFYQGPSMQRDDKEPMSSVNDLEGRRRIDEASFSVDDMLGSGFSIKAKKSARKSKSPKRSARKSKSPKRSARKSKSPKSARKSKSPKKAKKSARKSKSPKKAKKSARKSKSPKKARKSKKTRRC